MAQFSPYLNFPGNCREAVEFYREKLDAEPTNFMKYSESPAPHEPADADKIMHVMFKIGESNFMAADAPSAYPPKFGNNIWFSLGFENKETVEKYFNNLAEEGTVAMPLQNVFWGSYFGMVTDKFGVPWMLSCELPK